MNSKVKFNSDFYTNNFDEYGEVQVSDEVLSNYLSKSINKKYSVEHFLEKLNRQYQHFTGKSNSLQSQRSQYYKNKSDNSIAQQTRGRTSSLPLHLVSKEENRFHYDEKIIQFVYKRIKRILNSKMLLDFSIDKELQSWFNYNKNKNWKKIDTRHDEKYTLEVLHSIYEAGVHLDLNGKRIDKSSLVVDMFHPKEEDFKLIRALVIKDQNLKKTRKELEQFKQTTQGKVFHCSHMKSVSFKPTIEIRYI